MVDQARDQAAEDGSSAAALDAEGATRLPATLEAASAARVAGAASEVATAAADDLRGPSAALLRDLRQLRRATEQGSLPTTMRRALDSLERQASRVGEVETALLELQEIERGQLLLRRRMVDLTSLLGELVQARAARARRRGVELTATLPARPFTFPVDPERLQHMVQAMLDDWLGAARRGARVQLALEETATGLLLTIASHGTRARLHRAGRALRLVVARRLAELHGGSLEVHQRNGGVEARLVLPTAASVLAPQPPAPGPAGRARLLVVDDDPDAREALALMLGDDYDVLLAADGGEAVARTLADHPDVVLMDLYMPRVDGLAALGALRADPATRDLPVILISARGDELTRSRSLDLGAVDFLQKPFSARELKARLERTLRLIRRETELQELARTDPLTGLANVRAFRTRLDEEIKRARRYHTPLACVMVDMDNLKPINDELGHSAGDLALRAMADVIRRELRETDFGARYGGDEFVLLLPHTSAPEARVFAERVCARLQSSPLELHGQRLSLSASFGIGALGDELADDAGEMLVRRADASLYAAKRGGRGRVASQPSPDGNAAATP